MWQGGKLRLPAMQLAWGGGAGVHGHVPVTNLPITRRASFPCIDRECEQSPSRQRRHGSARTNRDFH